MPVNPNELVWDSSKPEAASVENGVITCKADGVATISASMKKGSYQASTILMVGDSASVIPKAFGDVNGKDGVTPEDALLVLQSVVNLVSLNQAQTVAADVDGRDGVTPEDALLILQKVVSLIPKFPVE